MSRLYYAIYFPRSFSNEYSVYCGTPHELSRLREILLRKRETGTYLPATREKAIRYGETQPRQAKRVGAQWFGGWAEPLFGYPSGSLSDRIKGAHHATLDVIDLEEDASHGTQGCLTASKPR